MSHSFLVIGELPVDIPELVSVAISSTERLARDLPEGLTPYDSKDGSMIAGSWPDTHPIPWTVAFWLGRLRAIEEVSGSDVVRERRVYEQERLIASLQSDLQYYNHDLGFIGILGFTGNEQTLIGGAAEAREICREGLMSLVHVPSGMVDTRGGDADGEAKAIVDSFMNVPLLFSGEASEEQRATGIAHERRLWTHLRVRPGHWFQGGMFAANGAFDRPFTKQGHAPDSTGWTRGLSWVTYGLRIAAAQGVHGGEHAEIDEEIRALDDRLLAPGASSLVPWDLEAAHTEAKDSGALAIALAGAMQFGGSTDLLAANLQVLESAGAIETEDESGGLLSLSTYHVPHNIGIDAHTTWGDYFYLEALLAPSGFVSPYRRLG